MATGVSAIKRPLHVKNFIYFILGVFAALSLLAFGIFASTSNIQVQAKPYDWRTGYGSAEAAGEIQVRDDPKQFGSLELEIQRDSKGCYLNIDIKLSRFAPKITEVLDSFKLPKEKLNTCETKKMSQSIRTIWEHLIGRITVEDTSGVNVIDFEKIWTDRLKALQPLFEEALKALGL